MQNIDQTKINSEYSFEIEKANRYISEKQFSKAMHHLERAHILGQRSLYRHGFVHYQMLLVAFKTVDVKEIVGQITRLFAVPLGWVSGWVPKGNTGRANVSAIKPMPLPEDMRPYLDGFSVFRDVLARALVFSLLLLAYIIL